MKSVPVSVRLSPEEAEFLARLQIQGATTPSEKLRAIIADVRRKQESPADYSVALVDANQALSPVFRQLQEAETAQQSYSAVVALLREWLPEMLAYVTTLGLQRDDLDAPGALETFESGVADRLVRLVDGLFQHAVTGRCQCYQPDVLARRMDSIRELARLILTQQGKPEEEA